MNWIDHFPEGSSPNFCVRAPGRVNLIGEHVDHQAYPVCPCAIAQALSVMVSVEPKTESNAHLHVAHMDPQYASRVYTHATDMKVEDAKVWTNYVCAAYFGIVEYFMNSCNAETIGQAIEPRTGLTSSDIQKSRSHPGSPLNYSIRLLYSGNVPAEAGLSSSAAVVVATSLAVANAGKHAPPNNTMADICARAERYMGVASGGMDQAAILLSQKGSATLIRFKPLETTEVHLPNGGALVITNTCRIAPKAKMASKMYNKRVFELKAGCLALMPAEVAAAMSEDELLDLQLRDVVRVHLKTTEEALLKSLSTMLDDKVWNKDDMTRIFGEKRKQYLLEKRCGTDVWENNDEFWVYNRVKHVLSEALRVEDFYATASKTELTDEEKLERLGQLMNSSGASLNTDFDCSCKEIESVVKICQNHGAYGTRLTGAGWGGCTVALVPEAKIDEIITAIKDEYFEPLYQQTTGEVDEGMFLPPREHLSQFVFSTAPAAGAHVDWI